MPQSSDTVLNIEQRVPISFNKDDGIALRHHKKCIDETATAHELQSLNIQPHNVNADSNGLVTIHFHDDVDAKKSETDNKLQVVQSLLQDAETKDEDDGTDASKSLGAEDDKSQLIRHKRMNLMSCLRLFFKWACSDWKKLIGVIFGIIVIISIIICSTYFMCMLVRTAKGGTKVQPVSNTTVEQTSSTSTTVHDWDNIIAHVGDNVTVHVDVNKTTVKVSETTYQGPAHVLSSTSSLVMKRGVCREMSEIVCTGDGVSTKFKATHILLNGAIQCGSMRIRFTEASCYTYDLIDAHTDKTISTFNITVIWVKV